MLKDVVSWLDYSVFDEIALVIFAICFFAIVVWALSLRRESTHRFGSIPLTDEVVDPRTYCNTNSPPDRSIPR
jgi:cytochrome c oxidase cbb3-type subunit 4